MDERHRIITADSPRVHKLNSRKSLSYCLKLVKPLELLADCTVTSTRSHCRLITVKRPGNKLSTCCKNPALFEYVLTFKQLTWTFRMDSFICFHVEKRLGELLNTTYVCGVITNDPACGLIFPSHRNLHHRPGYGARTLRLLHTVYGLGRKITDVLRGYRRHQKWHSPNPGQQNTGTKS